MKGLTPGYRLIMHRISIDISRRDGVFGLGLFIMKSPLTVSSFPHVARSSGPHARSISPADANPYSSAAFSEDFESLARHAIRFEAGRFAIGWDYPTVAGTNKRPVSIHICYKVIDALIIVRATLYAAAWAR